MKTISYGLRLETPRWLYPHSDTEDFLKLGGRNISRRLLIAHEAIPDVLTSFNYFCVYR